MKHSTRFVIVFSLILLVWLGGCQGLYENKVVLKDALFFRYALYFAWMGFVCLSGYLLWLRHPQWVRVVWLLLYLAAGLFLAGASLAKLAGIHFSIPQRNYIQAFRLFFHSPAPLVILHLVVKMAGLPPVMVPGKQHIASAT